MYLIIDENHDVKDYELTYNGARETIKFLNKSGDGNSCSIYGKIEDSDIEAIRGILQNLLSDTLGAVDTPDIQEYVKGRIEESEEFIFSILLR